MSLRILLADDSMTAQKMGVKILTEAGYTVTVVSNGAAAAKKLVDKPDLYILDMFMPGYTGVEICDKIRNAPETAKAPVILTVGKMEPYDPKEMQKVRADGVLVKPFEATDLLAMVKKIEQQIAAAAAEPEYEKTMSFKAPLVEEFKDDSYEEWKTDAADLEPAAPPPMVMSSEMGSAPAFGDYGLPEVAPAPAAAPAVDPDATVTFMAPPPKASPFDETVSFMAPKAGTPQLTPAETAHADALIGEAPEVEFTAAPKVADIPIVTAPELETSPTDGGSLNISAQDPSLVTDPTEMVSAFATKFGVEGAEEEPVGYVKGFEKPETGEAAEAAPAVDDFEARVAAAMSGFKDEPGAAVEEAVETVEAVEPLEEAPAAVEDTQKIEAVAEPEPEPIKLPPSMSPPEGMQDAALVEQMQKAFAGLPVETAPMPEEIAEPAPEPVMAAPEPPPLPVDTGTDTELARELAASVGGDPQVAPDSDATTQAIQRVLHRMMPSIMAEVARELGSNKKS